MDKKRHAFANQKGGVGKTATVLGLGSAISHRGGKALIVDMDPQANATEGLGIYTADGQPTTADLMSRTEAGSALDAVVATGCVIEGETEHFRVVCDAVTYGLTRIPIDSGVPVGNGVLTVQNQQQAIDRAGGEGAAEDKGADSALAAIQVALTLKQIANS